MSAKDLERAAYVEGLYQRGRCSIYRQIGIFPVRWFWYRNRCLYGICKSSQ